MYISRIYAAEANDTPRWTGKDTDNESFGSWTLFGMERMK